MKNKVVELLPDQTIVEGGEFYAFSESLKLGDTVDLCRGYKMDDGRNAWGKPIATGSVIENGVENPAIKNHPAPGTLRAWKSYWKIKVERIK